MVIAPASAWSRALSVRNTVVLPDPDGPITRSPCPPGTSKEMSRSTWSSPNALRTPRTVSRSVIVRTYLSSRVSQPALRERQEEQMTQ